MLLAPIPVFAGFDPSVGSDTFDMSTYVWRVIALDQELPLGGLWKAEVSTQVGFFGCLSASARDHTIIHGFRAYCP